VRPGRNPIATRRRPSIQAPVADPANDQIARKYSCATCKVTYEVLRNQAAHCPVCAAEAERDQLRQALLEANNRLERQTNELNQLRPQVDLVLSMRQALDLLDADDRMFLKSVAYRHRAGESISLKVISAQRHGSSARAGRRVPRVPTGLLAVHRCGTETHECTSLGGLAIAQYVRDGLATLGPITTMQHLMRAMSDQLTPAGGPG